MKFLKNHLFISLIVCCMIGCSNDGKNSGQPQLPTLPTQKVNPFSNPAQCLNPYQNIPEVGIPGNTACPYQGAFNPNIGYQGYAFHYSVGVGFRIDFGWDYNDMCPQIGQRPIFQNGHFSHCSSVNPLYAQVDENWFSQPNTGECTGDQLNPEVTGCKSKLQPLAVPNLNPQTQPKPVSNNIDPVLSI